jgi:altronate hydrolase
MSKNRTILLNASDNVAVAIDGIPAGETLHSGVQAVDRIPKGHKIATTAIDSGAAIKKFGQIIGFASQPIRRGEWVHVHNVEVRDFARNAAAVGHPPPVDFNRVKSAGATFKGYLRADGRAGTRNYLGILTSVNCSAHVAKYIAEEVTRSGVLDAYPNVDGVVAFVHGTGCAMESEGLGYDTLMRTQWGYATHPNLGAALMIGLGCETFQIARMKAKYGLSEGSNFQSMTIQDAGGTRAAIAQGVKRVQEMLPLVNTAQRQTLPASKLLLALQCGGSDGYSGLTANPALGAAVDLLVRQGGGAILSETPEIYGAEHLLASRAEAPEIANELMEIIKWWELHVARHGGRMDNNPSAGNKAGGLTTILEKSLGAAMKGGTTPLRGVYRYAERVNRAGFVFMDTPGFDPTSATGQVAGGANILCFTTGRGSAYGCKPTPAIKLATNTDIFRRLADDMDINCGDILDGVSIDAKGAEIFDCILEVASGSKTKSELLGYGDNEFVPWQLGVMM